MVFPRQIKSSKRKNKSVHIPRTFIFRIEESNWSHRTFFYKNSIKRENVYRYVTSASMFFCNYNLSIKMLNL